MNKSLHISAFMLILFAYVLPLHAQVNLDTVRSQKFDTGNVVVRLSTDWLPKSTYGLKTDEAWFEDVRLSALRLPNCTSSFVSENGLMMTTITVSSCNSWTAYKRRWGSNKERIFAKTMAEERKISGYYADQLVLIKDVTDEIQNAVATMQQYWKSKQ